MRSFSRCGPTSFPLASLLLMAASCGGKATGTGTADPPCILDPPPAGPRTVRLKLSRLDVGESPHGAWRSLGNDLDGVCPGDAPLCKRTDGQPHSNNDGGIDNEFGRSFFVG